MRISKIKLALITFIGLAVLLTPAFFALAQEDDPSPDEINIDVYADPTYDVVSREVKVPIKLINNTNKFFDNVYYEVEIHKGEVLKEEGYIFDGTEYMGGEKKRLGSVAPQEDKYYDFTYVHDPGIQSGTYFVKIHLSDNDGVTFSFDYSWVPLNLQGEGSILGSYGCVFRGKSPNEEGADHINFDPWLGWPMEQDYDPEVVMLLEGHEMLDTIKNGEYYTKSNIFERDTNGKAVRRGEKERVEVVEDGDTEYFNSTVTNEKGSFGQVIKDRIPSGLDPGTYLIESFLVDNQDRQATVPCYLRWVVKGPSGRVGDILTEKGIYRAGENYDLKVNVFGPPDDSETTAILKMTLYDSNEKKLFETSKNLNLGPEPAEADFTDFKFFGDAQLKKMELKLIGENGKEWDAKIFEYKGAPESSVSTGNKPGGLVSLVLAIFVTIPIIIALIYFARKKINKSTFIFLAIFLSAVLFIGVEVVQACYPSGLKATVTSVSTSCNSSNQATWRGGIKLTAGNCVNWTNYRLRVKSGISYGSTLKSGNTGKYQGSNYSNGGKTWQACCYGYNSGSTSANFGANAWAKYSGNPPKGGNCESSNSHNSSRTCITTYNLQANKTGTGSGTFSFNPTGTSCGGTDCRNYVENTAVAITPNASAGSSFTGWTGCDSMNGNVCNVTMTGAKTVSADFYRNICTTPPPDPPTVNSSLCTTANETVLTADTSRKLVDSCSANNGSNAEKCEYTCDTGYVLVGTECKPALDLTIKILGTGNGNVYDQTDLATPICAGSGGTTCPVTYTQDDIVSLRAEPADADSRFDPGWGGVCLSNGTNSDCDDILMNSAKEATAELRLCDTTWQYPTNCEARIDPCESSGKKCVTLPETVTCNVTNDCGDSEPRGYQDCMNNGVDNCQPNPIECPCERNVKEVQP